MSDQQQPLKPHPSLIAGLVNHGRFDVFSTDQMVAKFGMNEDEIKRAIRLRHIQAVPSATINGQLAYRKGENWSQ